MSIRPADAAAIEEAADRLARGETVAFPTETVYGLGADAASAGGVAAVYRIKGRPADHPLIVHVLDATQARVWGEIGEPGQRLMARFWPGPLTLIVRRRADAPAFACGGEATVGLRAPAHPVARALLAAFARRGGRGIAAPSANRFGRVSPTRAGHVAADLGEDVPLILDGGPCEVGVESTIVDLSRGAPVLLRPGGVPAEAIEAVLGEPLRARDAAAPRASGTLAAHYAPHTPLEVVEGAALAARLAALTAAPVGAPDAQADAERAGGGERVETGVRMDSGPRVGVWSRTRPAAVAVAHWEPMPQRPEDVARELYDTLRRLDALALDRLIVEAAAAGPAWDAVRDRLARAAATFSGADRDEGPGSLEEPT